MCRESRLLDDRTLIGLPPLVAVVIVVLCTGVAPAAELPETPVLSRAVRDGWLRFGLVSGRISVVGTRSGGYSSTSSSKDRQERLTVRIVGGQSTISYELSFPKEQFSVQITGGDRLHIRRSMREGSEGVVLEFLQEPGRPLSFSSGSGRQKRVYQAASLWHMLIIHGKPCRNDLTPLLKLLRPDGDLATATDEVEAELLRIAAHGDLPDHQYWATLVGQLADQRFASREAADRQLRSAGRAVLSFLQRLDFDRLDAEQQFRVRRIIQALSDKTGDDTAEQVATWLSGDREIWLSMLGRDEQSTRQLAAKHLGALLDEPIRFDPAADPATRKSQIEQLRTQLQ